MKIDDFLLMLFNSNILLALAIFIIKLLRAQTKNKNLQMFETWALQAAELALTLPHTQTNYDRAAAVLNDRLAANHLAKRFSAEQVAAGVNWAIKTLTQTEVVSNERH